MNVLLKLLKLLFTEPNLVIQFDPRSDLSIWDVGLPYLPTPKKRKVATAHILNKGRKSVDDCEAFLEIIGPNQRAQGQFPLHWADTLYNARSSSMELVKINPLKERRLDIAFTEESLIKGCSIASSQALATGMARRDQFSLLPGNYAVRITVVSGSGEIARKNFILNSPHEWQQLNMQLDEKNTKISVAQKIFDKWHSFNMSTPVKVAVIGLGVPIIMGIFVLVNTYLQHRLEKAPAEKTTLSSNSNVVQGSNNTVINISNPIIANQGPQLDSSKIELGERYAYAFDHFKGAMNELGNESRIIKPGDTLKRRYNPNQAVGITPSISNGNKGIPLKNVLLQMVFLDHGPIVERAKGWQTQVVNQCYSFHFAQEINNTPMNTEHSIFVKFPGTGKYEIIGYIDGSDIAIIKVPFIIELYE